jgi:glycosyltransferase involved in cell wall biosynthesis
MRIESKSVAILMCTYQGEKYLAEQLNSFFKQTYKNWTLYISDDHSTDSSRDIIREFTKFYGSEKIINLGPKNGFAAHFIQLTTKINAKEDYFAWSDQDDIWEEDKLEIAVYWLNNQSEVMPAVFSSRTTLVDKNNKIIGYSPLFKKPKIFKNALVQNVGGGNTMVFNSAAKSLLASVPLAAHSVSHDWLMYQVVTGCGGVFHYEAKPLVRYRQHEENAIGMNISLRAKVSRLSKLLCGRYKKWNSINIEVLKSIESQLLKNNQKVLNDFHCAKTCRGIDRIAHLKKSGVYRQGILENIVLYIACLFRRI